MGKNNGCVVYVKNVWLRAPWLFVGKWCSIGCLSLRAILVYMCDGRQWCVWMCCSRARERACVPMQMDIVWQQKRCMHIKSVHTRTLACLLLLCVRDDWWVNIIYWMKRIHTHTYGRADAQNQILRTKRRHVSVKIESTHSKTKNETKSVSLLAIAT